LVARHDREALTVPPNDPQAFSQALNRIFDDRGLAERLGAAARERAMSEFGESVFRARMGVIFQDALRARRDRIGKRR
jgi:rhamnosyl/mannosyltransferase